MGEWMYRYFFLDLGTSWRWAVSFIPRPLYPRGKSLRHPLGRRLGGPRIPSGRRGKEKVLDTTGTQTPTPRSSSRYNVCDIPAPISLKWLKRKSVYTFSAPSSSALNKFLEVPMGVVVGATQSWCQIQTSRQRLREKKALILCFSSLHTAL
jgi:hypothetical protein